MIPNSILFRINFVILVILIMTVMGQFSHNINEHSKKKGEIYKCCPKGYELIQLKEIMVDRKSSVVNDNPNNINESPSDVMTAESSETELIKKYIQPLQRFGCQEISHQIDLSDGLFGYNLLVTNDIKIPQCLDVELFHFDIDGGLISADGCVDYLANSGVAGVNDSGHKFNDLYGLKCSDQEQVEVHKLWKCCQNNWSYNIELRRCVINNNNNLLITTIMPTDATNTSAPIPANNDSDLIFIDNVNTNLLKELIGSGLGIFQTKKPICDDNHDVFVEYYSEKHRIALIRSGLEVDSILNGDSSYLMPLTFCVDGIITNKLAESTDVFPMKQNQSDEEIILTPDYQAQQSNILIQTCRPRSVCNRMPCVRRCCRNEQVMQKRMMNESSKCVDYPIGLKPTFHDVKLPLHLDKPADIVEPSEYGVIQIQKCSKYKLYDDDPRDTHYISHIDGSLHLVSGEMPLDHNNYCLEYISIYDTQPHTFVCFQVPEQTRFQYYAIGLAVSSFFLLITLLVYACMPKMLNLHGKTLVCHVFSLLCAYVALCFLQFNTEIYVYNCYIIGYFIFFGFLAAFCWQSIMCFDIWWTFGSVRSTRGMRKPKELKRFIFYSLYAWCVPLILTISTYLVDHYQLVPDSWRPQMTAATTACWFTHDNRKARFVFFLMPIGLHVLTNSVLFVLTALHCSKVKNEIHQLQTASDTDTQKLKKRFLADRAKYTMNIKLFVVMGVSWILEILATTIPKPIELWYFSDAFNVLQGVLIFLIFVFKWKVWYAIQQKLGLRNTKSKNIGGGTTQATNTTMLAHSISKDAISGTQIARYGRLGKSASNATIITGPPSPAITNMNINFAKNKET